jgi:two-component system cell cycle sensor histidine kinase/response regulator CckA
VVNARDAMPRGGKLTIETANVAVDSRRESSGRPGEGAPYVLLSVSDTGCGMDAETLYHVFEPFFTTKPAGTGTGLGLATVYGVVQQSGGHIDVASSPGRGTTFRVYLPRAGATAAVREAEAAPAATAAGRETILLVEDDDQVRGFARRVLESKGYTVLEASHPEAGLQTAEEHGAAIDLLLTDVIMPGMSGPEMAERITGRQAQLPVLYMSGYTDEAIGQHGLGAEDLALLHKPFTPAALTATVRQVLDRRLGVENHH